MAKFGAYCPFSTVTSVVTPEESLNMRTESNTSCVTFEGRTNFTKTFPEKVAVVVILYEPSELFREKLPGNEGLPGLVNLMTVVVPEPCTLGKFRPTPKPEPDWAKASTCTSEPTAVWRDAACESMSPPSKRTY